MNKIYLNTTPVFVSLTEGRVLEPLEIEVNDDIIEESTSSQGFVIIHGDCDRPNTFYTLGILAQVLQWLDNRLGGFRWRLVR